MLYILQSSQDILIKYSFWLFSLFDFGLTGLASTRQNITDQNMNLIQIYCLQFRKGCFSIQLKVHKENYVAIFFIHDIIVCSVECSVVKLCWLTIQLTLSPGTNLIKIILHYTGLNQIDWLSNFYKTNRMLKTSLTLAKHILYKIGLRNRRVKEMWSSGYV